MLVCGSRKAAVGLGKGIVLASLLLVLLAFVSVARAQADATSGADAYKMKCLTCHGADGSGNTPVGKSLKSADLRTPEVQKKSDAELAAFIATGKGNMPSFRSSTPPDQIQAIVKYIRSFGARKKAAAKN